MRIMADVGGSVEGTLPQAKTFALASTLLLGGVLYLVTHSWHSVVQSDSAPNRSQFVNVRVLGHIDVPTDFDTKAVRARVHFYDIPLDMFRSGKELFQGKTGDFSSERWIIIYVLIYTC